MPRVSVIMAVYNASRFLREAVGSILCQTFRDFELIAVDDASSDESLDILQRFADERIRIIRHEHNQGAALSRNDALRAARGEYVAIMDADDVSLPVRLEREVIFLESHPGVGLVGCGVYDNIDVDGAVLDTTYLPEDSGAIHVTLLERWCFLHPSIMFRRELLEHVSGYRREFEPAEDHDFILRLLEHCAAHNLQERLVKYRINPNGLSVAGHKYINELGAAAMHLAKERRNGRGENLTAALLGVEQDHLRGHASGVGVGVIRKWQNSFYAANRYYGFGCKELYAGDLRQAQRCFVRSIKTNAFFVKSYLGLLLSSMPFAVDRVRFVFKSSREYHVDLARQGTCAAGIDVLVNDRSQKTHDKTNPASSLHARCGVHNNLGAAGAGMHQQSHRLREQSGREPAERMGRFRRGR